MTASPQPPEYLTRADGVRIAYHYRPGNGGKDAPTYVFLPGYMSDMLGGKAIALDEWASRHGKALLRMDYSGCGQSGGAFSDGNFDVWRDDVLLAIGLLVRGPVVLIGSSMGGWLMILVALALGDQVKAMAGIAAAPDFTVWGFTEIEKGQILKYGKIERASDYSPDPTPTYRTLYESGMRNLVLQDAINIHCPVRLLHGQCDDDVPWDISLQLAAKLRSSDVQVTLVKDGDHRLSRPNDIALLLDTVSRLPTT
jgi:pimeloyl-ACP methyl ester carboxylesterase